MRRTATIFLFIGILSLSAIVAANVPHVITYQGHLSDSGGALDTTISMTFAIYDDSTGGTMLWSEDTTVQVASGNFTAMLGSINPVDVAFFDTDWRWLEITVGGEIITPRSRLTASPYAYRIETLDGATGGNITGAITLNSATKMDEFSGRSGDAVMDPDGAPNDGGSLRLFDTYGTETVTLLGSELAGFGPGGTLKLANQTGVVMAKLDGEMPGDGGELSLYHSSGQRTFRLAGEQEDLGAYMAMRSADGSKRLEIDAEDVRPGYGPYMMFQDVNGDTAVWINANGSPYLTDPIGGCLKLYHPNRFASVTLNATYGGDGGGNMIIHDENGENTVGIYGSGYGTASGGDIILSNSSGVATVRLSAEYGAGSSGRVITEVLEITGGSDLSEQFNVNMPGVENPMPGMIVSIDPDTPGNLRISTSAYDPTVAGIISGAGNIAPGMLMGHQGTLADGQYPIALTGRVYCLADASYGSIKPGDFLTTSDTPGHAMKATDRDRSYGAVIGKAMTGLEEGRDLVLVLVNLQ